VGHVNARKVNGTTSMHIESVDPCTSDTCVHGK
jgi:hypothetical protein